MTNVSYVGIAKLQGFAGFGVEGGQVCQEYVVFNNRD